MSKESQTRKESSREHQIDVIDHPAVAAWMKDIAKKDPEGFVRLIGPNQRTFSILFGKPSWRGDESKGWTHGWAIYENSLHWMVLTGPAGTFYRIRLPIAGENYLSDPRSGVGIVQYLQSLISRISS